MTTGPWVHIHLDPFERRSCDLHIDPEVTVTVYEEGAKVWEGTFRRLIELARAHNGEGHVGQDEGTVGGPRR